MAQPSRACPRRRDPHAFLKRDAALPTLVDGFLYRGSASAALQSTCARGLSDRARCHRHPGSAHAPRRQRIESVTVRQGDQEHELQGEAILSTIPLTQVIQALSPHAPVDVRAAAARLRYRDLVVVAVMLGCERATDQTWIYFREGHSVRPLHERPTGAAMAPPGRTLLVTNALFSRRRHLERIDADLIETTVHHLEKLGSFTAMRRVTACAQNSAPIRCSRWVTRNAASSSAITWRASTTCRSRAAAVVPLLQHGSDNLVGTRGGGRAAEALHAIPAAVAIGGAP